MAFDPAEIKQRQRIMWSSGNYPEIAQTIEGVAELVVERVGVKAGHDMLDVATGSGNVAIPAADLGAHVVGLDLTPELFVVARERAANAGVEVNWVEGDAEDLPFGDDSFDRVTSVFGAIFAPRHQQAASEIVRVCKPGGRFAIAAWTPEGLNGQMFKLLGSHMPPPPEGLQSPLLWGTDDHLEFLFAEAGSQLEIERHEVEVKAESATAWVDYGERVLGPMLMAKALLEPQGKWQAARTELLDLYERNNDATDGTMSCRAEYLIASCTLPA